jgi:hypothetical protein
MTCQAVAWTCCFATPKAVIVGVIDTATVTMVLEGEQFLTEMLPDGTTRSVHRKKGDYALSEADACPHDEFGGEEGGTILLSLNAAPDGLLFEYFDENMENPWTLSIEEYVDSWNRGSIHGTAAAYAARRLYLIVTGSPCGVSR